ncbi:MAG: tetratricopeptide repeat protein [Deinococcota bacterium]|nr:tetratricopeptide repeat protein [Deinococcota bacterium]
MGRPRVQFGRTRLDFAPDKRYGLLAYLAYAADWIGRDRLAYLFWPDSDNQRALKNLSQLLKRVRALDWPRLEADRYRLRWPVRTDVADFKRASERGDWDEAVALYGGPLLADMDGGESSELAAWLEIEREHLHALWRAALLRRARDLEALGRHDGAADLFRRLLQQDELDEEALRACMGAALRAGQREQALKLHRDFAQRLHRELALEPTSTTQQLARLIRAGDGEGLERLLLAAPAAAGPAAGPAALAVGSPPLPLALTSFVGRDLELAEIAHLLAKPECRLLTLVGPGGVGKTRLALQAAAELGSRYEGGVYFVPLETLTLPALIPAAVAAAIGLELQGQDDALAQLARHLGEERALLVLDNYEQLMKAALLAPQLLRLCPKLELLVTSRERLNVAEEWLLPVAGMPFPAGAASAEEALSFDAVQLFVQRAQRVRPGFSLGEEERGHVLAICGLVQGLPLGLELSAVWVRMMSCAEIAGELGEGLDFLASARNLPERQQSIRAVFEHSWRLLSPVERQVLAGLSVFRGGFAKGAAAVVVGASVAVLAALVDKSLLRGSPSGRYDRHPLLYDYSQEKLTASGEESGLRQRHAAYYLALAEEVGPQLRSVGDVHALDRLELEHENLRSALRWALAAGEEVTALRLAGALGRFWEIRGYLSEGCRWLEAALALRQGVPKDVQARALTAFGRLTLLQGNAAEAAPALAAGLELWREVGDKPNIAEGLVRLGSVALEGGDFGRAEALHQESLALALAAGDKGGVAFALNNLGEVARCRGDAARAADLYQQSLALHRETGNKRGAAIVLGNLGYVAQHQGELERAASFLRESLGLKHELGDTIGLSYCFAGLAGVSAGASDFVRAARLLGVTEALLERTRHRLDTADRADFARNRAAVRAEFDEPTFAGTWAEGCAMTLEQAVAYALKGEMRA